MISGRLAEIGEYPDADDIRVGVEAAEQFHGCVVLRVEQTEQYVLHTDVLVAESESLAPGTFESTFRPRHHRKMPGHVACSHRRRRHRRWRRGRWRETFRASQ